MLFLFFCVSMLTSKDQFLKIPFLFFFKFVKCLRRGSEARLASEKSIGFQSAGILVLTPQRDTFRLSDLLLHSFTLSRKGKHTDPQSFVELQFRNAEKEPERLI